MADPSFQATPVVLLIDEYDKPILGNLQRPESARAMRESLRNFYSVIKSLDPHLKFVLLTGASKFSKVSPLLASHATHLLPYRGLGSGIPRAFKAWPSIELVDDRAGNQFKAIIRRPVGG